jgi:hypothetical protein
MSKKGFLKVEIHSASSERIKTDCCIVRVKAADVEVVNSVTNI